jgi:hypothetical protein
MAEEKTRGGIKTHFVDAIVPDPGLEGDWGGTKDGDTSFQGAGGQKGTSGKIPEVTFVDVQGGPKPGSSATAGATGIANKGEKDIGGFGD